MLKGSMQKSHVNRCVMSNNVLKKREFLTRVRVRIPEGVDRGCVFPQDMKKTYPGPTRYRLGPEWNFFLNIGVEEDLGVST